MNGSLIDPRRVLVNGGAGFLGSYLCEWLLVEDKDVGPATTVKRNEIR